MRSFCSVVLLHGQVDAPSATLFRGSVAEVGRVFVASIRWVIAEIIA
jgi:hypothetical protein